MINKNNVSGRLGKNTFVGRDKSDGKYEVKVKSLELENKIIFLGAVNIDDINQYIAQCDVFIFPTLFDGWGAVLNEAASLGKPLIATTQAGASYHLIENGKNGFMVEPSNVDALKLAMEYYVDNPKKIEEHSKRSFEIFQDFTPEKSAHLFTDNLRYLIKNK